MGHCENCCGCKNSEAKITIIIPELLEDKSARDVQIETMEKNKDATFGYYLTLTEDGVVVGGNVGACDVIIITDRQLEDYLVLQYYNEVMSYHQAIDEELLDEEYEIRDQEVKEKWLNGNFNYWILDYKREA